MKLSSLSLIGLWIMALLLLAGVVLGDDTKLYKPTEVQSLRLQVAQKNAQIAQIQLAQAQSQFQKALADLVAESDKVKGENGWGKEVQFSPDTLAFTAAPPPAPATNGKKP